MTKLDPAFKVKWTPGPWHTDSDGIIRHSGIAGVLGVKIGSPWQEDAWSYRDADAETLANASLIAAAPELYEALAAVDLARHTDAPADWGRATKLTDAALAKARGQ